MQVLCLFLPRFGIQVLRRDRPEMAGKPVVMIQGCGDTAVVSGSSAPGVSCGMAAGHARHRAPSARFVADNASDCLDELDRMASIVRRVATPLVEIGGRSHLFVDMAGLNERFADEVIAASRLAAMIHECTRYEVRGAVAETRSESLKAAKGARQSVQTITSAAPGSVETIESPRDESLSMDWSPHAASEHEARKTKLKAQLSRLGDILEARGRGYRTVEVELSSVDGVESLTFHPSVPMYTAHDLQRAVLDGQPPTLLSGVEHVRIRCSGPAPDVRVRPQMESDRTAPVRASRPRQLLLKASA